MSDPLIRLEDGPAPIDWDGINIHVAGLGVTGRSVARILAQRGAHVTVIDQRADQEPDNGSQELLDLGVHLATEERLSSEAPDLVVASPGWRPDSALFVRAESMGIPVWGELDVAWRLRTDRSARWLALTGTNGKTTAVKMLESMLRADGIRAIAAGNVGLPVIEAVVADPSYDVLALELSSFQLHRSTLMEPAAAAVLNVAPDHLDWHGGAQAYAAAKGRIYERTQFACVYNVQDQTTRELVEAADVQEGARGIGFTLGIPSIGQVGVVEDLLVDRAYGTERSRSGIELATLDDVKPNAPHNVANALAAAALARAVGVKAESVSAGLQSFVPEPHRIALVAERDGIAWIDDSKATNPHAAAASLAAFDDVVWIAGGLAKGAEFDDLVQRAASRLRAVILIGTDRQLIADALARHAPDVPVVDADDADTGPVELMGRVVQEAIGHARSGSTVLLAPACASMDRFRDYHQRGEAFVAAVRRAIA